MLHYDETKNPGNAYLPGVPLADLTDEQLASYPQWLRDSILASGFWSAKPIKAAKTDAPAEKADKE